MWKLHETDDEHEQAGSYNKKMGVFEASNK